MREPALLTSRTIFIDPGDSLWVITKKLDAAGLQRPLLFLIVASVRKPFCSPKWGEFLISKDATIWDILQELTYGRSVVRKMTIPEGWSVVQVEEILLNTSYLKGEIQSLPQEGSILPDTYIYTYGMKRQDLLALMESSMREYVFGLLKKHLLPFPINNERDLITLASIVEKETGIAEERPRIAAVFLNRLRQKMRLQSDPTVIFAITKGKRKIKLLKKDLTRPLPYNTYYIYGLPPGPIACPGKEALKAVLNPAESHDLYFVANGTGGHSFSKTYEHHLKNVKTWRKIQASSKSVSLVAEERTLN